MLAASLSQFTVDTHLFRELGELLVGRDSTAVVELIKNAYDADATEVVVSGINLDHPDRGIITIEDNGIGMRPRTFSRGFLRIASRAKDRGDRRSRRFHRRFTGAKGVGRLAAHKLARNVEIRSIPWRPGPARTRVGVDATIDWDQVEAHETLADVTTGKAVNVRRVTSARDATAGTKILLTKLRRSWTADEREVFMREVQTFAPPAVLVQKLPANVVEQSLLFQEPVVRDTTAGDPGWQIRLEGEFEPGELYWQNLAEAAAWVLEIDARADRGTVRFCIAPTKRTLEEYPVAECQHYTIPHPDTANGPWFHARIFVREGRRWDKSVNGPRVYMEGFRVLPYGESRNDWLGLDHDYATRVRELSRLGEKSSFGVKVTDEGLVMLPARHYLGAIFLTQTAAPTLRMLVNREGFVPNPNYESLVGLIRTGIDLSTRVRAATSESHRATRREERKRPQVTDKPEGSTIISAEAAFRGSVAAVADLARGARQTLAEGDLSSAVKRVDELATSMHNLRAEADALLEERTMVRVLASVGLHRAAFIHEIRGLLGMAEAVESGLASLRSDPGISAATRRRASEVLQSAVDLRRGLERQAAYLTDIVAPDARRRRSRVLLQDRFDAATRLVRLAAERVDVKIENTIPSTLRLPRPMFPAEIVVVFSNLLTNAVKAASPGGKVVAEGWVEQDQSVSVRISNTGTGVRPEAGERWFRPFESTTTRVDSVLGQGMGLGLPITRALLEEYGAQIQFVNPPSGYSAAVQVTFPAEV